MPALTAGSAGPPPFRRRSTLSGPESAFVSAALASHGRFMARVSLFREPELPTGFPDLVVVVASRTSDFVPPARFRVAEHHLKVLHHLSRLGCTALQDVAESLLLRMDRLETIASDLVAAELALIDGRFIEARRVSEIFHARRIVAIEAKMRDWRRAIEQARANTWFASHSLILLPKERFNNRIGAAASEAGIGVLTFDGTRLAIPVKALERPLPASYGSWLFSEWALRGMAEPVGHA